MIRAMAHASGWQDWQTVTNEHWPKHPADLPIHEPGISVEVRAIFETDGGVWLPGVAKKWDREHVWVECADRRLSKSGLWVAPADVRRQT